MTAGKDAIGRWAARLASTGAPGRVVESFKHLRTAVATHQSLLRDEGIGVEIDERDRVRVNARRVGLKAPLFADETDFAQHLRDSLETHVEDGRKLSDAETIAAAVARVNSAGQ